MLCGSDSTEECTVHAHFVDRFFARIEIPLASAGGVDGLPVPASVDVLGQTELDHGVEKDRIGQSGVHRCQVRTIENECVDIGMSGARTSIESGDEAS